MDLLRERLTLQILARFILVLSFFVGCQPYIDQVDEKRDFRSQFQDFGTRRELKLVDSLGDRESLLLVFNQPLGELAAGVNPAPFIPSLYPRVVIASVEREGAAGVRVRFASKLPAARIYTATIPSGWRAMTGATFLRPHLVSWETERPDLSALTAPAGVDRWKPNEPLTLVFNQPVEADSIKERLRVTTGENGAEVLLQRAEIRVDLSDPQRVTLVVDELELNRRYRLSLKEGIRPKQGRLVSAASRTFEFGPREYSHLLDSKLQPSQEAMAPASPLKLDYRVMQPSATTMVGDIPEQHSVKTWEVSERESVALMLVGEGRRVTATAVESRKTVYAGRMEHSSGQLRVLPNNPLWTKTSPYGVFWVKLERKELPAKRFLVLRTGLTTSTLAINNVIGVEANDKGVRAALYSVKGELLAEAAGGEDGVARFRGPFKAEPHVAVVRRGAEVQVAEVVRQNVEGLEAPNGVFWSDRSAYRPGEELRFHGAWWGEGGLPLFILRESSGRETDLTPTFLVEGRLFSGAFTVPKSSGRYTLEAVENGSSRPILSFEVSDIAAQDHPSSLAFGPAELGEFRGSYTWNGPGGENLGVRARLDPDNESVDGWTSGNFYQAKWWPVTVEVTPRIGGADFRMSSLPDIEGPSVLEVELYDTNTTSRVYRSETQKVGEREVSLRKASSRVGTDGEFLYSFEFSIRTPLSARERLECELQSGDKRELTDSGTRGSAIEAGEVYRWMGTCRQGAPAKLTMKKVGPSGSTVLGTWVKPSPRAEDTWGPLSLSSDRVKPTETLPVAWPGGERERRVWLGLAVGDEVPLLETRRIDSSGNIGFLKIPALSPGVREVVVLAVAEGTDGRPSYRSASLSVDEESVIPALHFKINGRHDLKSCKSGESLEVEIPEGGGDRLLCWWEPEHLESFGGTESSWRNLLWESSEDGRTFLPGSAKRISRGPLKLDGTRFTIEAPSTPGSYILRVLSDSERRLRFHQARIEVLESTHWSKVSPLFARAGDLFSAGVRLTADPKARIATGATTSVSPGSSLLPLGYHTTSALVEAGKPADMMFDYQVPANPEEEKWDDLSLLWEIGVHGAASSVAAKVPIISNPSMAELFSSRKLEAGAAVRMTLPEGGLWRMDLESPGASEGREGEADLEISLAFRDKAEPSRADGDDNHRVVLDQTHPRKRFLRVGRGTLEIKHRSGPRVKFAVHKLLPKETAKFAKKAYLIASMENDAGETKAKDGPVRVGEKFHAVYSLVVPERLDPTTLEIPLPGGVEVSGCWLRRAGGLEPLTWVLEEDGIVVELPGLEVGEAPVVVLLESLAPGDYFWPSPTLYTSDRKPTAAAESRRLIVVRR